MSNDPTQPNPTMEQALSARKFEVLEYIARGCKNREIVQNLDIQEVTVRYHIGKILKKLGVKNRTQAACLAVQNNWIQSIPKTIV
jgi:DNA-binding NarL/FixJ family response regulator